MDQRRLAIIEYLESEIERGLRSLQTPKIPTPVKPGDESMRSMSRLFRFTNEEIRIAQVQEYARYIPPGRMSSVKYTPEPEMLASQRGFMLSQIASMLKGPQIPTPVKAGDRVAGCCKKCGGEALILAKLQGSLYEFCKHCGSKRLL